MSMKTIIVRKITLAATLFATAASACAAGDGVDVFNIQGYVNFGATLGPVVTNTFGITTGDSFTGTLTYNSSAPPNNVYGPGSSIVGYQLTAPLISLTVQGQNFSFHSP